MSRAFPVAFAQVKYQLAKGIAALVVALLSFQLSAQDNIFENGTVDLAPKIEQMYWRATCTTKGGESILEAPGEPPEAVEIRRQCAPVVSNLAEAYYRRTATYSDRSTFSSAVENSELGANIIVTQEIGHPINQTEKFSAPVNFKDLETTTLEKCPPPTNETYIVSYTKEDGSEMCFDPNQADLVDSCKASTGNYILNKQVTVSAGCQQLSDGSICHYTATDVGGGNQVYQMDLETSCYGNDNVDNLDTNTDIGDMPSDNECVDYGGLLGCPEDPDNVCDTTSSTAFGGNLNQCKTGCGYVNDQFLCFDQDLDGDGLPDYNDPDIDGDGIPNKDDLDSDGDGKDDPINDGGGNGNNGGNTVVNVDLSGVEKRLDNIHKELKGKVKLNTPNKEKFNKMFDDEEINELNEDITKLEQDIKSEIDRIRAEASGILKLTVSGSGYEARNLTLTHGTYDVSLNRFSSFFSSLGAPIMLICSVVAAYILLGSRN